MGKIEVLIFICIFLIMNINFILAVGINNPYIPHIETDLVTTQNVTNYNTYQNITYNGSGGDCCKNASTKYLYNDTHTIYFNETSLNNTLDSYTYNLTGTYLEYAFVTVTDNLIADGFTTTGDIVLNSFPLAFTPKVNFNAYGVLGYIMMNNVTGLLIDSGTGLVNLTDNNITAKYFIGDGSNLYNVNVTGLGGDNSSFNQTLTNSLYYSITNPLNFINHTTNNSYYLASNPNSYITYTQFKTSADSFYYPLTNPNNYINHTTNNSYYLASNPLNFINESSGSNSSFNQTLTDSLYYSKTNPNNYINHTTNNSYYLASNPLNFINHTTNNSYYLASNPLNFINESSGNGKNTSTKYLYNDTNTIYFNETSLNDTIDIKIQTTTYYPTLIKTYYGDNLTNENVSLITSLNDGYNFTVQEETGTNALEIRINFTNVNDFNFGVTNIKYSAGSSYTLDICLYNYNTDIWDCFWEISQSQTLEIISGTVFNYDNYINDGVVQTKIQNVINGNVNNIIHLDYFIISSGISTITSNEHDTLTKRNDILNNHPNIIDLFYNKTQVDYNFTLYYPLTNPNNYINHTTNNSYYLASNPLNFINHTTNSSYLYNNSNLNYTLTGSLNLGGNYDTEQIKINMHSSQSEDILKVIDSSGNDKFTIDQLGYISLGGGSDEFNRYAIYMDEYKEINDIQATTIMDLSREINATLDNDRAHVGMNFDITLSGDNDFTRTAGTGGLTNIQAVARSYTTSSVSEITNIGINAVVDTGYIVNYAGIGILQPTTSNGGSITNGIGLYIQNMNGLSSNKAITTSGGDIIFNEVSTDSDVRMESDGNQNMFFLDGGNDRIGIGTNSPSYPLHVATDVGDISIYASKNISATGFITRTSIYDKTQGNALDKIKDSSELLDAKGEIDHKQFYGYTGEINVTDYTRPEIKKNYNIDTDEYEDIIYYPHTKKEEGVLIDREIELLRQAIYELKTELNEVKEQCNIK